MKDDMEKMEMGETPEEEVKHHSKGFLEKAANLKEGGKKKVGGAIGKSFGKSGGK